MRAPTFARLDSPLGGVLCVRSDAGIARVAFAEEREEQVLREIAAVFGAFPVENPAALQPLQEELDAYFDGTLRAFGSRPDLRAVRGFPLRVLEATARIPYGSVASYGELAACAGSPRAARAAGTAMRRNPVALLVPCHRVVPADGSLGGYSGHEDRKAFLLELEEAAMTRSGRLAAPAR